MKKRVLSGLLAAILLLTTAFAAGGDAVTTAETTAGTLTFAVTLPEQMDTDQMEDGIVEQVRTVLESRLEQLALSDAQITFPDDRKTVIVTLPEGADAPDDLAAFLTQPNVLSITNTDGTVQLTSVDVTAAEAGLSEAETGAYIQLTLSDDAQTALETLTEEDTLTVTLDGESLGETATYDAESGLLTLPGGLDLDTAKLYVARITAGTLPVTLTLADEGQPEEPEEPAEPAFPDIAGHWAEDALNTAVEMGLINGVDDRMLPNNAVKRSEALVMLNRALGATIVDDTSGLTGTSSNAWYAEGLGKAIHLGLIDKNDSRNFDTAATRAEAFEWFASAFVFNRAEAGEDALSAFTDTGSMTAAQKQAAAALVSEGIVNGMTATTLEPQSTLTRAQFVTMITRVADEIIASQAENETEDASPAPITGGTIFAASETVIEDTALSGDLIFSAPTQKVTLDAVTAHDRVALKGTEAAEVNLSNASSLGLLALDPAVTANVSLTDNSTVDTLVVAGEGGTVNYAGAADTVEIVASNRTINLYSFSADTVIITGSDNTIVVDGAVGSVAINGGAKNNHLTLNKSVDNLLVAGVGSTVDGKGNAGSVDIRAVDCNVSITADSMVENIDAGLTGVSLTMSVPDKVKAGGSLTTTVTVSGVSESKVCVAQWYKDGKAMANYRNDSFQLTEGASSSIKTDFTFTKDMKLSVTMGFKLLYDNPSTGETEELYVEKTVPIENYSDEWYYQRDVNRVLNLVSSTYRGNYTSSYAINNDYKSYEKEVWINAKGYSSKTQYLCWINRAYQHVNVFQGSKGKWKLIKSFLVGTGAASTPTPTGVTTVSYKSAGGWTTSTYTVRPVVGFYPGTGYAFHSRLCYPGTDTEYDFSAGYPVSHGCVRMYKNDIKWIYNNIPVGTTVVIY